MAAPPTALLSLLHAKHAFVRSQLEAGKVPPPAILAAFLQSLVNELGPLVKASPAAVGEVLKEGLHALHWVVATNSPASGSAPPNPAAILTFLDDTLRRLLPSLSAARSAAAEARRALAAEERELNQMEEEALDGVLG